MARKEREKNKARMIAIKIKKIERDAWQKN
jgi:hypothetical protein